MGPIQGAISDSSQQFSLDYNRRKKSPQGWFHAGLVDFTELQYIIIWWSWRELNPRPKFLHPRHYMLSPVFTFAGQLRTDTPLTN